MVAPYEAQYRFGCIVGDEYWISTENGVVRKPFPIIADIPLKTNFLASLWLTGNKERQADGTLVPVENDIRKANPACIKRCRPLMIERGLWVFKRRGKREAGKVIRFHNVKGTKYPFTLYGSYWNK